LSLIGALTCSTQRVTSETILCNPASKLYKLSQINNHLNFNQLHADRTREGGRNFLPSILWKELSCFQ
jgi:hypothetical protein